MKMTSQRKIPGKTVGTDGDIFNVRDVMRFISECCITVF